MKRILFLNTLIILITFNGCAQQDKMKIEDIKEIWVYDYFNPRGYTTAGVAHKFQDLENNQTAKIQLDSTFVESLKNMLFYSSAIRKTFQEKTGQNLIFAQFVMKDGGVRKIIINSIGIVDYFAGNIAYFFIDNSDKNNKTLWLNNYYGKIKDEINDIADSESIME
jgi:hypothetical protein